MVNSAQWHLYIIMIQDQILAYFPSEKILIFKYLFIIITFVLCKLLNYYKVIKMCKYK